MYKQKAIDPVGKQKDPQQWQKTFRGHYFQPISQISIKDLIYIRGHETSKYILGYAKDQMDMNLGKFWDMMGDREA